MASKSILGLPCCVAHTDHPRMRRGARPLPNGKPRVLPQTKQDWHWRIPLLAALLGLRLAKFVQKGQNGRVARNQSCCPTLATWRFFRDTRSNPPTHPRTPRSVVGSITSALLDLFGDLLGNCAGDQSANNVANTDSSNPTIRLLKGRPSRNPSKTALGTHPWLTSPTKLAKTSGPEGLEASSGLVNCVNVLKSLATCGQLAHLHERFRPLLRDARTFETTPARAHSSLASN